MPDTIYVLDLQVTGAELVTVNDDGGMDSIVVEGVYDRPVEISLGWTQQNGKAFMAGAMYFGFDGLWHRLLVNGQIEDAAGSNGCDSVFGNEFANRLSGDQAATGAGGDDTLHGGSGNDVVSGGAGDDRLFGDDDDDQLSGDDGVDTVIGGAGSDTVAGGAGADILSGGGSGGDTVAYLASSAGVQVDLTFGAATSGRGGDAEGDVLDGFANVIGSNFADWISDTIAQDLIEGSNANVFSGNGGADKLYLGGGNDSGYGGNGNDIVLGQFGDDALFGGSKKDRLTGGFGQDSMSGGTGADRFIFKSAGESAADAGQADVISDFLSPEGDRIDLRAIDADPMLRGNQAFRLIDTEFHNVAGELLASQSGADLVVAGDIDGDAVADFVLLILNTASLSAADFVL